MVTGCADYIKNGDVTTGEYFLCLCAHFFFNTEQNEGGLTSTEIQTHFEPKAFYYDQYLAALEDLDKAINMTVESARSEMKMKSSAYSSFLTSIAEDKKEVNKRCKKIRNEIEKWIPPTDLHSRIKKMALEQIDSCISPDDEIDEYIRSAGAIVDESNEAVETYIENKIKLCSDMVDTYRMDLEEELALTKEKNEFMNQLLNSLKNV